MINGLMAEPMEMIISLCLGLETKIQVLLIERETASSEAASEGTKTEANREVRAAHTDDCDCALYLMCKGNSETSKKSSLSATGYNIQLKTR